jgi:hypothetical protein
VSPAPRKRPARPIQPAAAGAGYSGTPLPQKLGIKPGMVVAVSGAPQDFERTLGTLPEGARLAHGTRGARGLTLCFVTSRRELERKLKAAVAVLGDGGLWIAWPKKSSGVATDVTEDVVREVGLREGIVDIKVCAIDATWSGLRFGRRRSAPGARG